MNKDIYINDMLHRYPGYHFEETINNDLIKVRFKNDIEFELAAATKIELIDAYRAIRLDILNAEKPAFLSSTVERDALTDVDEGIIIFNIDTLGNQSYSGAAWVSVAGEGSMLPASYGSMFENNPTGSPMNSTTKQWITADAGKFDGNGIVSFANDPDGDQLIVGANGVGDYMVIASCGQTNSGGNLSIMNVHVNGVESDVIKDEQNSGVGNHRALVANGILTLAENDYLTMHIVSSVPSDVIEVYDCHLTIQRIS